MVSGCPCVRARVRSSSLLFLVYVNDMPLVVNNKLPVYADDSAILVADKSTSNIELTFQKELEMVSDWLVENKLSLHLGKTESILFGSKVKLRSLSNLNISCKRTDTEPKESVTYLGAILELCFSGETMVQSILQKANARLNFLFRKQKFLNLHTKTFGYVLIQCHFDYASSLWYSGLSKLLRNRLQVTKYKMIRFILKLDPWSHLGLDEFKSLGWLPVSKRVDQMILNQIIKSGTSRERTLYSCYLCAFL